MRLDSDRPWKRLSKSAIVPRRSAPRWVTGGDLLLHGGKGLLGVRLLAQPRVELAHGALEVLRLRERAIRGLALGFERGRLLHHRVAERLERRDLALELGHRVLYAVDPAHGLLDAVHAALLVGERAAQLVAPAVERFHLGHRELVRVEQAVLLFALAGELCDDAFDLAAERLGLAAQVLEGLVHPEERLQSGLERLRLVHLVAELLEHHVELARMFQRFDDLLLGPRLPLRERFGTLVERAHLA